MMTMSRTEAAFRGLQPVDPDELGNVEFDTLLTGLASGPLTPQGQAFYDWLNADGLGVGMTEGGTLVYGPNERP